MGNHLFQDEFYREGICQPGRFDCTGNESAGGKS